MATETPRQRARCGDQVAQPARRKPALTTAPSLHGGREFLPETLKLAYPVFDCSEMIFRERKHARAGRSSIPAEAQKFPDFIERKPDALRSADENEFFDRTWRIQAIAARRTRWL